MIWTGLLNTSPNKGNKITNISKVLHLGVSVPSTHGKAYFIYGILFYFFFLSCIYGICYESVKKKNKLLDSDARTFPISWLSPHTSHAWRKTNKIYMAKLAKKRRWKFFLFTWSSSSQFEVAETTLYCSKETHCPPEARG